MAGTLAADCPIAAEVAAGVAVGSAELVAPVFGNGFEVETGVCGAEQAASRAVMIKDETIQVFNLANIKYISSFGLFSPLDWILDKLYLNNMNK